MPPQAFRRAQPLDSGAQPNHGFAGAGGRNAVQARSKPRPESIAYRRRIGLDNGDLGTS